MIPNTQNSSTKKRLLDGGVITQQEFEREKSKNIRSTLTCSRSLDLRGG
jgi:hypothetical protein